MKNGIVLAIVIAAAVTGAFLWSGKLVVSTTAESDSIAADGTIEDESKKSSRPTASPTGPWPVASVESTTYQFGQMQVGAEREHIFTIKNDGEDVLKMQTGKSTCKCTAFLLSKNQLEVGEEASLTVRWKGKLVDPKFEHGGPVYTNDPKQPTIQFKVTGVVDNAVEVLPGGDWNVGNILNNKPGVMDAHIISRIYEDFAIESIESDSPFLTVETRRVGTRGLARLEAKGGHVISATVSPDIPPAIFTANLTVKVDCSDEIIKIPVRANKSGPLQIMPLPGVIWIESHNGLMLGQFSGDAGREAQLALLVNGGGMETDLEFTEVKAKPTFLKVELSGPAKTNGDFRRYPLKIIVPPGAPPANHSKVNPAVIEIHTNHPSGQILTINVSFRTF